MMKRYLLYKNHWIIQEASSIDPMACLVCLKKEELMHVNSQGQTLCCEHKFEKVIVFENKENIEGCVF